MIKRPSPNDTEEDILKMQSDFLLEQYKDKSFEPAAKVVKVSTGANAREPSSFAKKRAAMRLQKTAAAERTDAEAEAKPSVATQSSYTPIIGDIVERCTIGAKGHERHTDAPVDRGFPRPERLRQYEIVNKDKKSGKSLFAMSLASKENESAIDSMECNDGATGEKSYVGLDRTTSGSDKSYIVSSGKLATEIHNENLQQMAQMGEVQLLEQRRQLLESMDPDLIKFIQSKRRIQTSKVPPTILEDPAAIQPNPLQTPSLDDNPVTSDILNDPNYAQWPNFDVIEPAKLEWMRNIQATLPPPEAGVAYEARFDWKGVLLPFSLPTAGSADTNADEDVRDLFLHGADAQRPGYTLQELFRLARSKVMQQRLAALAAIAGILNIHNQGFYDAVLEVPVSKCFFLLRFAFDENIAAITEVSANALATLLHNDADEILLDFTRDCSVDFREPVHEVSVADGGQRPVATAEDGDADVERKFAQMHLSKQKTERQKPMMQASVADDGDGESNRESLNDFHLAEIDLVECVLRTNIVKRINYVLFTLRSDNSTVISCLKILIRLARSGPSVVRTLFEDDLLRNVCTAFLPPLDATVRSATAAASTSTVRFYGRPQYLALKLVRCVASYGREWCDRLLAWGIFEVLKSYVFVRDDIKIDVIKLQIEAFRLAKVIILSHMQSQLYDELAPAMLYMLEWSYQFLQFERADHLIIRQHAAALLTLISSQGANDGGGGGGTRRSAVDKVALCTSKWFRLATVNGCTEFSQHMLLATCTMACTRLSGDEFHPVYAQYLTGFLASPAYATMCAALVSNSPLLRPIRQRSNPHETLPHLHSVVMFGGRPDYVFGQQYAVHLFTSLAQLLTHLYAAQHRELFGRLAEAMWRPPALRAFFEQLAAREWNADMRVNWFVRNELAFVSAVLKLPAIRAASGLSPAVGQQLAFKLVTHLSEDQVEEMLQLFDAVLFDAKQFDGRNGGRYISADVLDSWKQMYMRLCFEHVQLADEDDGGLMVSNHRRSVLPQNWPCTPLLLLLRRVMHSPQAQTSADGSDVLEDTRDVQDLICCTLTYIDGLLSLGVTDWLPPTEHLMLLMIAFVAPGATFLGPVMGGLLAEWVARFFAANAETHFDLENTVLEGGTTFENLYLLLLDHFQGTSFGDRTFGALVMVPLAQRYAVRWRHLVWSEHMAVMRFMLTPVEQLLGGCLGLYEEPAETDVTQLKYYYQAQQTMRFAEDSVAARLVRHHLNAHRERRQAAEKQRKE